MKNQDKFVGYKVRALMECIEQVPMEQKMMVEFITITINNLTIITNLELLHWVIQYLVGQELYIIAVEQAIELVITGIQAGIAAANMDLKESAHFAVIHTADWTTTFV
ncbi:MAG: hypothetical protein EZS28_032952, partial [Streblomastix strix]